MRAAFSQKKAERMELRDAEFAAETKLENLRKKVLKRKKKLREEGLLARQAEGNWWSEEEEDTAPS